MRGARSGWVDGWRAVWAGFVRAGFVTVRTKSVALAMAVAVVLVGCSGGACPEGLREVGGMCVPEDAGAGDACVPGAETCDNTDEDCDGAIDEEVTRPCGTDRGACETGTETCTGGVWGRCVDPVDPSTEVCDGSLDDDCDGAVDEACACPEGMARACGTTEGLCETGGQVCTDLAWGACEGGVEPVAETCDGLDEDCDGMVDEGLGRLWFRDADADAFGDPDDTRAGCSAPEGYVSRGDDCDDSRKGTFPGAPEACGGEDEDCDGRIDEGASGGDRTFFRDADGDGFGDDGTTMRGCDEPSGYVGRGGDCDDSDNRVHPDQTGFFSSPATGGGYDFDCDGAQTREFTRAAGSCELTCPSSASGWSGAVPSCGAEGTYRPCSFGGGGGCSNTPMSRLQTCR